MGGRGCADQSVNTGGPKTSGVEGHLFGGPPISAETCKLFVSGLRVGSQRTFATEFTKLCHDCLGIQLATVNVSVVGVDAHGLSRAVMKLQTVDEAKQILEESAS